MVALETLIAPHSVEAGCAAEAIRTPGFIQSHGVLICVEPVSGFALAAASANASTVLGLECDPLGQGVADILGHDFAFQLAQRQRDAELSPSDPWETSLTLPGGTFDVACHAYADRILIELEIADPHAGASALRASRQLQRAIAKMRETDGGIVSLANTLVRSLRLLTGFERVLVYRFDAEWNGQAIAEDQVADWEQSLLGLHFPASDIPAQARQLYCTSLMRRIPDRDAPPVPLRMAPAWSGAQVDLSHARLRALSPIHLQYHRNLGVDGTMSISVLDGRTLWGLVVFHHRKPHATTAGQRAAAAALTDAFSLRIGPGQRMEDEAARRVDQRQFALLIAYMAQIDELHRALTTGPVTLQDLFDASGSAVVQGQAITLLGKAPPKDDVLGLARWLRMAAPPGDLYSTSSLPLLNPAWAQHGALASGLLAVFLTADRSDMLLWFRPEEPTLVSWGGSPHKTAAAAMVPRLSFERWVEERRGRARIWAPHDVETATMLRHAITEVILRNLRRIAGLNDQLRQSQKMEAVGQLTGGLAHDFNNLLGGMIGSLELARKRVAQGRGAEIDRYLEGAVNSAHRAAALTHRLLAFSRRQTLDARPVDVNRLVTSMEDLIRRTIGPAMQVAFRPMDGLWTVLTDANQLENVLLNLALNARDAMTDGGSLTLSAANVRLDEKEAARLEVAQGQYVSIAVSDTGHGMPPEVAARVFEPFFTTKPLGEGTGLGLSMVYGFSRQSGGQVQIDSEAGRGTTVRLYLPRHIGAVEAEAEVPLPDVLLGDRRRATVLVVDDEPLLRMMVTEYLEDSGFSVLEAANGPDALAVLRSERQIDLLVTDIGLPGGMNGRRVAEAARGGRSGLKVLFITGYADTTVLAGGLLDPVTQVLTKPFGMQELMTKIQMMLS